MKNWKKVTIFGTAALAALTLAACGQGTSSAEDGKKLTIGYWKGSDTENATLDKMIKQFEEENDVDVVPKVYTDITTQLPTDLSGGTAPDAFYIDSAFFPYLQEQGVLNDLSDVINQEDFYPTISSAFEADGKPYAAAKDVSTLAIYINKDIFEKAGIDQASIPKSYEELVKWAPEAQAKIDAAYGKGKVYLINQNADLARTWPFQMARGTSPITEEGKSDLANPDSIAGLKTIVDLFNAGAAATPQQVGAGDEGAGFATGKFAMTLTGNWNYKVYLDEYKDLNFNIIPNLTYQGKPMTMQFTVGWGEYKNTKSKDLADKWIKFVTGKEGMTTWTNGVGTLATRPDVAEGSAFLKENPRLQVHQDSIKFATSWQSGTNLTTVQNAFGNFIPTAFKQGATADDLKAAMEKADKEANSKIGN